MAPTDNPAGGRYPLDFSSPVRHVATRLVGAAPAALTIEELADTYSHPVPADLGRITAIEGVDDPKGWLMGHAVEAIRVNGKTEQVADDDGAFRALVARPKLGRKLISLYVPEPTFPSGEPTSAFDPMSGRFKANLRRATGKDSMGDLRESMEMFGWLPEFPAIRDERGVVLVGHRRLAVAKELEIEPVIRTITCGQGEQADVRRFRLAFASNLGAKPFTPQERQDISVYLHGERKWSQEKIADALQVSQKTVSKDLAAEYTAGINNGRKETRGRPRKPTPEQAEQIIENYHEFGGTMTMVEVGRAFVKPDAKSTLTTVGRVIDRERVRRDSLAEQPDPAPEGDPQDPCPHCGLTTRQ